MFQKKLKKVGSWNGLIPLKNNHMKINIEKVAETVVNIFAIAVGVLLVGTCGVFIYAILKSIFGS